MKSILLVLAALVSLPSFAQSDDFSGVIDALTLDLNGDGGFDRAVLNAPNGGDADLYVYLSSNDELLLEAYVPEAVFAGGMWGMLPSLSVNKAGSLLIKSENSGIGRNRWEQTLTVAYREGQLLVGGITYSWFDTLDQSSGSCDLNLFTGKGVVNGKQVKTTIRPIVLTEWNGEIVGQACGF